MNPPTLITDAGITLCADHAAGWLRGGIASHPATPAETNGRGCHVCESESFVSSDQVVTTLIMDAVNNADVFPDADRPLFPLEFADTARTGRSTFVVELEDGTRWMVWVMAADAN